MPSLRSAAALAAFVLSLSVSALAQSIPPAVKTAEASIDPERIRAHVKFLSDDLLEGRGPGLRGSELAAKYIATQFALSGLKPGGDNGTYFQQINFVGMKAIPDKTTMSLVPKRPEGQMAITLYPSTSNTATTTPSPTTPSPPSSTSTPPSSSSATASTAPEFNWNDYANIDVKGKVILCIVGDPPSDDPDFFGGNALTYYGRWTYKFEQAARMGAIGALIIHRTDLASYGWDVVKNSNTSEKTYLRHDKNPQTRSRQLDPARRSQTNLHIRRPRRPTPRSTAAGKRGFKAVELPVRLHAHIESTVRPFQSPNVIGILPGVTAARHRRQHSCKKSRPQ